MAQPEDYGTRKDLVLYRDDKRKIRHIHGGMLYFFAPTTNPLTIQVKTADQMKWVGLANACRAQAEEVILNELVYC